MPYRLPIIERNTLIFFREARPSGAERLGVRRPPPYTFDAVKSRTRGSVKVRRWTDYVATISVTAESVSLG